MLRRIVAPVLTAAAATVGLVIVTGVPAYASFPAPEGHQCPSTNYLQISRLSNFRGAAYCFNKDNLYLTDNHYWYGKTVDNTASSVRNRYPNSYWAFFSGANFTGRRTNVYPSTFDEYLGNDAVGDNAVSSLFKFS